MCHFLAHLLSIVRSVCIYSQLAFILTALNNFIQSGSFVTLLFSSSFRSLIKPWITLTGQSTDTLWNSSGCLPLLRGLAIYSYPCQDVPSYTAVAWFPWKSHNFVKTFWKIMEAISLRSFLSANLSSPSNESRSFVRKDLLLQKPYWLFSNQLHIFRCSLIQPFFTHLPNLYEAHDRLKGLYRSLHAA